MARNYTYKSFEIYFSKVNFHMSLEVPFVFIIIDALFVVTVGQHYLYNAQFVRETKRSRFLYSVILLAQTKLGLLLG